MKKRYHELIKKYPGLEKAVEAAFDKADNDTGRLAAGVFLPVALVYTMWILEQAERKGIKRLCFLARDGYVLYHIARVMCERWGADIECSYFYCSRYALRMAAYRFFDDSAFDKLFIYSYKVSPYIMLNRAGFDPYERQAVYTSSGFEGDEKQLMSRQQFRSFCDKIRSDSIFRDILRKRSGEAYRSFEAYVRQEGIDTRDHVGIVDLGWTGSMQYTLTRLLESMDVNTRVTGFYMGMLCTPPREISCETWLFHQGNRGIRAWFSHNLAECVFTAPHGQTMGYEITDNGVMPVLNKDEPRENRDLPGSVLELAVHEAIPALKDTGYHEGYRGLALSLLRRVMMHPRKEEADALSSIVFCDDVGEQYHKSIAEKGASGKLRKELILHKFFDRDKTDGYYWYYGSLAAGDVRIKGYYRYGYYMTRYILSLLR